MIQRTRLARGLGVVLLAALVVTVVVAIWAWHWSTDFAVQLTAVAVVFGVGTVVLAVFAGVVAVLAYIASIQPPDLDVTLRSPNWDVDRPVFVINPGDPYEDRPRPQRRWRRSTPSATVSATTSQPASVPSTHIQLQQAQGGAADTAA